MRLGALSLAAIAAVLGLLTAAEDARVAAQSPRRVTLGPVSVNGPVPVPEARRVLAGAQRAFQQCYDDRLRERQGLAGRTVTRIFVSSDGGPIVAQVDESNVGDPELERCIKRAALVLAFSEHDSADSHVRFELRFGDARRPSGEAHTVTAGPEDPRFRAGTSPEAENGGPPRALRAEILPELVAVSGGRPEAQVEAALRRAMPRMRSCYERSLARDRTRAGALRLRFVVDARGHAKDVLVEEDPVGDAELVGCLGRVLQTTRFPDGARGTTEVVARVRMSAPRGLTEPPIPTAGAPR